MESIRSDADRGRLAAQSLWQLGLDAGEIDDPLTPGFARAALAELEHLQKRTPGVLREVLEGAQMSAEQLNVESFHGLIEVVQNADDLRASEVRVAVRKTGGQSVLLVAHNGERVELRHVVAMTLAFVSTKRDDPRAKGRFGIGLKSLGRLGERLTVHCAPYHFTIAGNQVSAASAKRSIVGFYDAASTETLLELQLRPGFEFEDFATWFSGIGSESMLFLDTVRSLRLEGPGQKRAVAYHRLIKVSAETVKLPGHAEPCSRTTLREPRTGRTWERYEIDKRVPSRLSRRYKATAKTTPIAIAIPGQSNDSGQIYAGLPLGVTTHT